MKNLHRWLIALCAALLVPAAASAALDMYLTIEGAKGGKRIVHCPDGACVVTDLAPDLYSILVCDAQGNVIASDITLQASIVSPRDVASGQATGKRMHKPIRITKDIAKGAAGRSTSSAPPTNAIAIDEPGVHLAIGVSVEAVDAAVAREKQATKSRSNIQNN